MSHFHQDSAVLNACPTCPSKSAMAILSSNECSPSKGKNKVLLTSRGPGAGYVQRTPPGLFEI